MENPYHILGVSPNASSEDIKKAYRVLAMRHHPDRNTHENAESRFNAIKWAYELLSDQNKRNQYNQSVSNRIILDSESEARALWEALFKQCDIAI